MKSNIISFSIGALISFILSTIYYVKKIDEIRMDGKFTVQTIIENIIDGLTYNGEGD